VCCGVGPRLGNGSELAACLIDCVHRVKQIPRGSGQAVEFPDNNNVAWADLVEHALKFRPLPLEAGNLFAEDLLASGLLIISNNSFDFNGLH